MDTGSTPDTRPRTAARAILYGALAVGVLDGLFAATLGALKSVGPVRIFQSVASGLLGRDSYQGGLPTALLGLILHFFIAFCVAAVYYGASRQLTPLARRPFVYGPFYGVAVYFFMQNVVIPLSAIVPRPPTVQGILTGAIGHVFFVGLPAAFFSRVPVALPERSASRRAAAMASLLVVWVAASRP